MTTAVYRDLEALAEAVREFLRAHPSPTRRQLADGVEGARQEVLDAFELLVERGEAEYIAPERPGQPGQCVLLDDEPSAREDPSGSEEELWRPATRCPNCYRVPPVRFTGREVRRAKRERQSARVQTVRCPHCHTMYWIQARHVAEATLDRSKQVA